MGNPTAHLSAGYLDRKRRELLALREQLRSSTAAAEAEDTAINLEAVAQVQEYEDDAQRLEQLEHNGNLVERGAARLVRVERALQKIADGTYGLSDISGQPISAERLEALPDAITTIDEQQASERTAGTRSA